MKLEPAKIYEEYRAGVNFKTALGIRGLYEQSRLNRRFYVGDQWHGAKCGNDRPLVRHNIIKRIGDFKMSQILSAPVSVHYSADGVPNTVGHEGELKAAKRKIARDPDFVFAGEADGGEINLVMSALGDYQSVTAERVGLVSLYEQALKNAYISGGSVLYTYWDDSVKTGLYADAAGKNGICGDIGCEVLEIEDVYFADPQSDSLQDQPYIILTTWRDAEDICREAKAAGVGFSELQKIREQAGDGKIPVLTKLYREYKKNGTSSVYCTKTTERAVVRPPFDTRLRMYPLALFCWENGSTSLYGDSEVTYLIPNQIAINRMITANVWAAMTMGMPMMVVNGDTVTENITNDPGQIIRVFGSNEDVAGAVKYVTPPDFSTVFTANVNNLIENTLKQSGANEVALGDSRPDNASALLTMRDAATMPLQLIRSRFYTFIEELSRIWADFWITQYGNRRIKIEDENGIWYLPFCADRYRELLICAKVDVGADTAYSAAESINALNGLYEKGIITKQQYLKRLPAGIVPDLNGLIREIAEMPQETGEESKNDGI